MANAHGLFWNSEGGDRVYDANDFAEWLRKFFTTGVFTGDLIVTAAGGMTVSVSGGYANIEGKVGFFETATTLPIANASGSYGRIDSVVAECNYSDRDITLKIISGEYSANPIAKAPERSAAAFQLVLAHVAVGAGVTQITQADITDTRTDTRICGIVAGAVKQLDFSSMTLQFEDFFDQYRNKVSGDYLDYVAAIEGYEASWKDDLDEWRNNQEAAQSDWQTAQWVAFETWLAKVKDALDDEAAASLAATAADHEERLALVEYMGRFDDYFTPVVDDDGNYILDDEGNAIFVDWKYKYA